MQEIRLDLIVIGDGRPNVVQIVNYDVRRPGHSFPAVMLHGMTHASTASALAGETIDCDVYYQASADAPIAMTRPGTSQSVSFESINPDHRVLSATLGRVELLRSDDQTISIQGGKLTAAIPAEGK
jgi:hypothetical protein